MYKRNGFNLNLTWGENELKIATSNIQSNEFFFSLIGIVYLSFEGLTIINNTMSLGRNYRLISDLKLKTLD